MPSVLHERYPPPPCPSTKASYTIQYNYKSHQNTMFQSAVLSKTPRKPNIQCIKTVRCLVQISLCATEHCSAPRSKQKRGVRFTCLRVPFIRKRGWIVLNCCTIMLLCCFDLVRNICDEEVSVWNIPQTNTIRLCGKNSVRTAFRWVLFVNRRDYNGFSAKHSICFFVLKELQYITMEMPASAPSRSKDWNVCGSM